MSFHEIAVFLLRYAMVLCTIYALYRMYLAIRYYIRGPEHGPPIRRMCTVLEKEVHHYCSEASNGSPHHATRILSRRFGKFWCGVENQEVFDSLTVGTKVEVEFVFGYACTHVKLIRLASVPVAERGRPAEVAASS
ncbi:MAG: hypothetical protein RLZZ324_1217 [Candidatus Parcubacteria bacterium]|jgi:hypothetical protein